MHTHLSKYQYFANNLFCLNWSVICFAYFTLVALNLLFNSKISLHVYEF